MVYGLVRIRQYITEDACRKLICSLVTSRLDYGNALLYGLPTSVIQRLQRVQNTAEENVALGLYGRISFALLSFSQPCFALVVTFE
jgi:hypothetical protein